MTPSSGRPTSKDHRLVWILGAALGLTLIVLLVTLVRPGGGTGSPPTTADSAVEDMRSELPDLSRRVEGDPAALGAVDAPVVLIEFADYRCPFCAIFARETLPVLMEEYVDEGLLRIEWRDTPVFGEQSVTAAVAARAAGEQGLFWEYGEAVFEYPDRDHQDLPRERLLEIAEQIDVPDMAAFEAALDDPALLATVTSDAEEATALGVRSTPTFIVGKTPLMGAQPVATFREAIEAELALAEQG